MSMVVAIGDILTPAMGVALSPFPVVAVILMLLSEQGQIRGMAFAGGWVVGLAAMVGVVLAVSALTGIEADADGPSTTASIVRLALGLGLVALAVNQWRKWPRNGEQAVMPGWMTSIERASPGRAFTIGAALAGLNLKNLMFNIVAGAAIASSGASIGGEIVAWALYILLASTTVIVPLAWYLVSPASATARLDAPRQWLIRNNNLIVALILLAIGVAQVGEAITNLGS